MTSDAGSSDLAVAGGVIALAGLVAGLTPGGALVAVAMGAVALGLGCASLLLPRRARRAGAVVAVVAAGVLVIGAARLLTTTPDMASDEAAVPASAPTDAAGGPAEGPAGRPADGPDPTASAGPSEPSIDPGATVVAYEIVTDGMSVTHLSYVDLVGGVPTMVEKLGVPPPFRHVVAVPEGLELDLTDLSVTGMGGASARRTTCRITVDGTTVDRASADGAYGLVTCAVPAT